ncbi:MULTISPECIES: ArsR family transcriptional regulator [Natrinema]|uniref:transcriptional regulator FilR1 domain-containing protein n=1 Tax=Natrinema TaxID=88723 RepID=UPI0024066823|nr:MULTISPECIES: ArsR family transcriptional regulator [Natrinema]
MGDTTVTGNIRRAKNLLTGEKLVVRNVINETVDSARLEVLRAMGDFSSPVAQTDIAQQADISRQAASNHLAVLRDRGFIKNQNTGIELTAGGLLLLDVIENCLQTVSVEGLSFLTRSVHPIGVLRALEGQSYRPSKLESAVSSSPSRPTIGRILKVFEEYGWSQDGGGQQQITSAGTRALNAYVDLATAVKQLIEKAPWLQRLPREDATFPISELADAELIISDPTHPSSVLWAALKLYDRRTSRFRGFCSIFNPVLFHAYRGLLELGIECEAILDLPTYVEAAENPQTQYVVHSSTYNNYQPLVLDRAHTLGIGIYDTRKVAIGAYNESGSGKHIAMIVSSNKRLVEWGINLYESYRAQARPASELEPESV